jgi:hypothetical protein
VTGDWRAPLSGPLPAVNGPVRANAWLTARGQDARWVWEYARPWVRRRLTGTSTGDGLRPKRPDLLPVLPDRVSR